jgi:hypothetical protein
MFSTPSDANKADLEKAEMEQLGFGGSGCLRREWKK